MLSQNKMKYKIAFCNYIYIGLKLYHFDQANIYNCRWGCWIIKQVKSNGHKLFIPIDNVTNVYQQTQGTRLLFNFAKLSFCSAMPSLCCLDHWFNAVFLSTGPQSLQAKTMMILACHEVESSILTSYNNCI